MKRLLFVSPFYPHPLDRGQNVRIHHLLRACSRDHAVTLVVAQPADGSADAALEAMVENVITVGEHGALSLRELLALMVALRSVRVRALRQFGAYLRQLRTLDLHSFDVIWVERLALAPLFRQHGRKVIIDLDDLEHRKRWRATKVAWGSGTSSLRVMAHHLYYTCRYALEEVVRPHRILAAVVASPQDASYLRRRGVRNAWVVPNGVAVPPEQPPRTHGRVSSLLYLGNLDYPANRDALVHARDSVLPELQRRGADVALHVIGPGADPQLQAEHPGVVFHGFVDDLDAAFAGHDVFLAPIRIGGGTKLKVLEAMAQGMPLVSTSVGAEGLGLQEAEAAAVADTPEGLAEAVLALDADPQLAARLASNAWQLAHRFSWDVLERDLADRLQDL